MSGRIRTRNEYGGFLPLELNSGEEWFADYEPGLVRFNSVKASLSYIIDKLKIERLFIPFYYCPSTIEALEEKSIEICFFHIGEDLLPLDVEDTAGTAVLIVNYFGILDKKVEALAEKYQRAILLLDNAHAFFFTPIMRKGAYNIYSAKKFFGIPDGAYIIGEDLKGELREPSYSNEFSQYLLKAFELGTDAAYELKKDVDRWLSAHYGNMSVLSKALLENVNYSNVLNTRRNNFQLYHKAFGKINGLRIDGTAAAYHYPLLLNKIGNRVKRDLIRERIYVPSLWRGKHLLERGSALEMELAEHTVFLPMDQRYGREDIEFIIERAGFYIHEYT